MGRKGNQARAASQRMIAWPSSKQKRKEKKKARMALPANSSRNLCEDTEEYKIAIIVESNTLIVSRGPEK
jgi:hypothetical protein